MQQFSVEGSGKLRDLTITDAVERLKATVPAVDSGAAQLQLAVFKVHAMYRAALAAGYERLGVSVPRANLLRNLYLRSDKRMTLSELSAYLEASLPSTMRLVAALEAKGLVSRRQGEHDRRLTYVELTPSGEALARQLLPVIAEVWADLWRSFAAGERERLARILRKLRSRLLHEVLGLDNLLPFKMRARRRGHLPPAPAIHRGGPGRSAAGGSRRLRDHPLAEAGFDPSAADPAIEQTIASLRAELGAFDESAVEVHLAFSRACAVQFAALSSRYEAIGLSVPRLNTLQWLYNAEPKTLTISELSALLEASLPTVLRMVRVLEAEHWVCRTSRKSDRRITDVALTPEGRKKFGAILPAATKVWADLWSYLDSEEQKLLAHLLSKLRLSLLTK